MANISDLSRPIILHVCCDRTLTARSPGEKVFNGVALPVFSVDTIEEAKSLIAIVSSLVPAEHPKLRGQVWYKITGSDLPPYLELSDMPKVADRLREAYRLMKEFAA